MSERIQRRRVAPAAPQEEVEAQALTPQTDAAGLDALLAEIDSVLETDATEYVRGFVQKGGQ